MKKRILSMVLCLCMAITLLPVSALAADATVTISGVTLTSGKYYTASGTAVTELESAPDSGGYLYFSGGKLTVSGDVGVSSAGPCPLTISGDKLTIDGAGSLSLNSTISPVINIDSVSLALSGSVDFRAEQTGTGGVPAVNSGSLETEDGYSGDITVSSNGSNAFADMSAVDLQTTGDIAISGGGTAPVIFTSGAVALEGHTISLTNSAAGVGRLISAPNQNVSIIVTGGDLILSSTSDSTLFVGDSGTVTLFASGHISVTNSGTGIVVTGALNAAANGNITLQSASSSPTVTGATDIAADGDVIITNTGSGLAVGGALTVTKAASVTLTAAGSSPTVSDATDITADGDITITNTGTGMAVANKLTATSTNGSVAVEGKNTFAPAIGGTATITAAKDITITSASEIDIAGTATLSAPDGIIMRTTSKGSAITTKDGGSYAYGGDVETSGLNLSGKNNDGTDNSAYNAPTEVTRYKAGEGYALFTPADGETKAKLELNNATINTASGRALYLPAEPVDIIVTGNNALTANGSSYNFVIDPNVQAVSITGEGSLTLTGNKGIASWDGSAPSVTVDIDGELKINTPKSYSIYTDGEINLSAASITTGIICAGENSFAATAKTGNLTIDNGESNSDTVIASNITMNAPDGEIAVTGKASSLLVTSGKVDLNAKGNVTVNVSENGDTPIRFGTGGASIMSGEGSIIVTTDGYNGIEKNGGSVADGVTLNAAKDITLNAGTVSVSASDRDISITAGGKLSSTSAYGFQVRALTIKANEVSIEGTQQDGIQATSVSITNPTGGNCKSVSVTATSSDDSWAAIHALGDSTTGNITVKADDVFICGNNSAKAINALGTVTIGDAGMIVGAIAAGTKSIAAGVTCANVSGGDVSTSGLDLYTDPPTETTLYTAGTGYILWEPTVESGSVTGGTVTLHDATIDTTNLTEEVSALKLRAIPVTIVVNGTNNLSAPIYAIFAHSADLTIQGDGTLNFEETKGGAYGINCSSLTITGAVSIYGDCVDEDFYSGANDGSITIDTTGTVDAPEITSFGTFTYKQGTMVGSLVTERKGDSTDYCLCYVYGSVTLTEDFYVNAAATEDGLTVESGATLTIPVGITMTVQAGTAITNNGAIVNNGIIVLPDGTDAAAIKALKLTGSGVVNVNSDYYTNDGVAVKAITGGLDLSTGDHSTATLENDGYTFSNNTLTLSNTYLSGGLTLPCNTVVTINTTGNSSISGGISAASDGSGYSHAIDLTFTGTGSLTISGVINGGVNGDTITVQSGARVTMNGSISIGASGTDGTLNVMGSGTVLDITSDGAYGAFCDTVNVQNGAALTVHTQGAGTRGVEALSGGINVTGGSTLTVGCDYGLYIIGGKLTVDSTSKLITNGAVAPFCIVGAANSAQSDVLSLAVDLPSGTVIASRHATNGSGTTHTYWSLVPTGGNLTVSDMDNTPVTLAGAVTGSLTFAKAASTPTGGGSGSSSYTLTFETNGGSTIEKLSKTSGAVIDLSAYNPTRDGYDFAGWYSDAALTEKITSVTLTKNTTVYAKWTEQAVEITNPFADITDNDYYYDAVLWALEKGVTNGTTSTTFSPDMTCTRAQAVTFLWRAEGSPAPTATGCPFTDVAQDAYYYKAVLWAIEKGITKGTSATTFSPEETVTRSQTMTFLWREAGEPTSASANPFTDVDKDAYYYSAVLWAVEQDVTTGTSTKTFSPDDGCTRAQIVTLLYRYMAE